jgi:glucose/arabinose dehydrogenase
MPHCLTARSAVSLLASSLVVGLLTPAYGQDAVQRSALHDYRVVTVASGLVVPWGMAFLPGGDMLVTERPGRLRIVRNGQLVTAPVEGVPAVRAGGQGGLLDVVVHPRFAENKFVYLSYSKPSEDGKQNTTAVVRGRFENDRLTGVQSIIEAKAWSEGEGHFGSRLAFDRDGFLFVTIGDRQVFPKDLERHPAQDLSVHNGKVLRLHDDGKVPADNPFVGREGALPEIWSYGHRNPQGLVIDPDTNAVWITEHGPQGGDELNLVERGKNYGWPVIGFGVMYRTGAIIHAATIREGMEQPVHVWVPSIAVSGLMQYRGTAFSGWRNNIFAGGLGGEQVVRLTLDGKKVLNAEQLVQRRGRIRDVRQGPDGFVYVAFESRDGTPTSIVRLEPASGS